MKFSVLLPTRNRLELLKYAIASVLEQDESDFEIIVFDNDSTEDIKGYIESLCNARVKYFRTSSFVSVTENWNNALDKSTGDWVIMLGDDDCLMKGYFSTVRKMLEDFPNPDFIYMHGFLFAYPGVIPGHPKGFARTSANAPFFINQSSPRWISPQEAQDLVREIFNFRCVFTYNSQYVTVSRSTIDKLKKEGKFYHSPYPDYYSTTTLMFMCERILSCPYPLVAVGISPKSFGYYYFNNLESKGVDFLNNLEEKKGLNEVLLPGSDMNTSWLLSLEKIKDNFEECSFSLNYNRYRLLQILFYFQTLLQSTELRPPFRELWRKLSFSERCVYGIPWIFLNFMPFNFRQRCIMTLTYRVNSHVAYPHRTIEGNFENIQQFYQQIDPLNFA